MATRNQRQEAQKRARMKLEEDRKKLEQDLGRKRKATENAWIAVMDFDRLKFSAGQALGVLLELGQSREDLMEEFGLSRQDLNTFLKAEPVDDDEDQSADADESSVSSDAELSESDSSPEQSSNY